MWKKALATKNFVMVFGWIVSSSTNHFCRQNQYEIKTSTFDNTIQLYIICFYMESIDCSNDWFMQRNVGNFMKAFITNTRIAQSNHIFPVLNSQFGKSPCDHFLHVTCTKLSDIVRKGRSPFHAEEAPRITLTPNKV